MLELLKADGPDPDHAEALMLYGRLVGTWDISNSYRFPDGEWRTAAGVWRFGSYFTQIGRSDGAGGMIQEGVDDDGRRSRWTFSEVTPSSFRWQGFTAAPGGEFELFQEMRATLS
ncbi:MULTISPECIES: hypothetical protein [Kribbella]|uniref:DUF1579 domain-containing protein n=1 Tax=Kribbella karoonensis TaxID=324851 RepID=A0ABN2D7B1_9ACTN